MEHTLFGSISWEFDSVDPTGDPGALYYCKHPGDTVTTMETAKSNWTH